MSLRIFPPAILVTMLAVPTASAGTSPWQRVPLPADNAQVLSMAVAPSQPTRVYLGLNALGVWRTDNRGDSWTDAGNGLPIEARVSELAVSPTDPGRVFAGIGSSVYLTTDAGNQWSLAGVVQDPGTVSCLVADPSLPAVALAGVASGSQPGVYRTTDSGGTWTFTSAALGSAWIQDLAADPANAASVLAATDQGMARSTDGGLSWSPGATTDSFSEVEWSAADPSLVYARRSSVHVDRSTDGGVSFTEVTLPPGSVATVAAHPQDASQLLAAGTAECAPINSSRTYVWKSTDQGGSWAEAFADPSCNASYPRSLAFDPANPTHVYLGETGQRERGFRHSSTGGTPGSWTEKVGDIDNFEIDTLAGTEGGTAFARSGPRLFRSTDGGTMWSDLGNRPDYDAVWSRGMEANERTGGLLLEFGDGLLGDIAFSFAHRSTDNGLTWSPLYDVPPSLPAGAVYDLASNHGLGLAVYASTWSYGLFRSVDAGSTYALVNPAIENVLIAVLPSHDLHLFLAGGTARMEVSLDGGATTAPRNTGLPAGASAAALFLDAAYPDHLEIVYHDGRVYETANGGLGWWLRITLPVAGVIRDAAWDPVFGHVFLATSQGGVVTDHPGYSAQGLPALDVRSVRYSITETTLYAGTARGGLWSQFLPIFVDAAPEGGRGGLAFEVQPNPFRTAARVDFVLPAPVGAASLAVYDVAGRRVRSLATGPWAAGPHRVDWDGRNDAGRPLAAGVYFVRLATEIDAGLRRVVLLR